MLNRMKESLGGIGRIPGQYCFFAEDDDAKAKADADAKAKADADAEAKKKAAGDSHTVTVDGQEMTFTLEELKKKASESAGAQKKFEEASKIKKDAEAATRVMDVLNKLKTAEKPDKGLVEELCRSLGIDPSSIPDFEKLTSGTQGKDDKGKKNDKDTPPKKVGLGDFDDKTQAVLKAAEVAELEAIRKKIEGDVKKAVDKDSILGKMVDGLRDEEKSKVMETFFDMAMSDVRVRIAYNELFGAEMVESAIQKVRAQVKNLGIPAKSIGEPPVVGLGPMDQAAAQEIRASEPIKRVPVTDPNYMDNLVKRALQDQYRQGLGKTS